MPSRLQADAHLDARGHLRQSDCTSACTSMRALVLTQRRTVACTCTWSACKVDPLHAPACGRACKGDHAQLHAAAYTGLREHPHPVPHPRPIQAPSTAPLSCAPSTSRACAIHCTPVLCPVHTQCMRLPLRPYPAHRACALCALPQSCS
eukprot:366259-Chlamydomonas_euryale.AAC.6